MTRLKFKKHRIERTCTKKYSDYHRYKPSLQKDFGGHCAYCNLNEEWITLFHEAHLKQQDGMIWIRITVI